MLDPKKRDGLSNGDARFLEIIDKYGWHVMSVAPLVGEKGQSFAYSTGLFMRFQHPEIILCGLDPEVARVLTTENTSAGQAGFIRYASADP